MDIAVPGDNVLQKETERYESTKTCQERLKREIKKRDKRDKKVVGALGSVSKKLAEATWSNYKLGTKQEQYKSWHFSDRHISSEKCWKSEVLG